MADAGEFQRYLSALEERLGCTIAPGDGRSVTLTMDGRQPVSMALDFDRGSAAISAPVRGSDGADRVLGIELMKRNFPSDELGGGMLVAAGDGAGLELVSVVPLSAVTPIGLAEKLLGLAVGAAGLADWIERRAGAVASRI